MKRVNIVKLAVLVLLVAAAVVFSAQPLINSEKGIPLGLDLRGGVHLVLQAEPGKMEKQLPMMISTRLKRSFLNG